MRLCAKLWRVQPAGAQRDAHPTAAGGGSKRAPGRLRTSGRAARDRIVEQWLVLACGVAAAIPILVMAIHAVAAEWTPTGDRADFAVRAFDVLTGRSPLVGPWSSGATVAVSDGGEDIVHSPGPMLFWLLAVPARFFDPSALQVTAGVLNVASVIGIVALARRRGGRPLMLATAIALPLMLASLPVETYSDIWNSSVTLLPLALLVFLSWSLACGEYRLLPLTVLVASFLAQTHLTVLVPTLGVLAVGLVGLVAARRFGAADLRPPVGLDRQTTWPRLSRRRWAVAAGVVGLLCWSAPLIDQAVNRPGNLRLLATAATTSKPTLGLDAGWRAAVHTIGVPPWWLQDPREPIERIGDLGLAPGTLSVASTALVLGALVFVAVIGWRCRRAAVVAAGALGLVLCAAVGIDAASTPRDAFVTVQYTMRWASPAGMCVWLVLGWSLCVLLFAARPLPPLRRTAPAALSALAVAAAVGAVVGANADPRAEPYREMRMINDRLLTRLPAGRTMSVEATSFPAFTFRSGIVYGLRREGREVTAPGMGRALGPEYEGAGQQVVRVDVDAASALPDRPARGRRIARLTFVQPQRDPARQTVTVTLLAANVR